MQYDPMGLLYKLLAAIGKAPDGDDPREPDGGAPDAHEQREAAQVAALTPPTLRPGEWRPVVNLRDEAGAAKYADGRNKRRAYPPVDLSKRRVVAMLHQTGFTWKATNSNHSKITAHGAIRVDGAILDLHPLTTRLVAGNRIDRDPWHGIHLEVVTNAEGVDGSGNWYKPDVFGRGRASDAQIDSARQWLATLQSGLAGQGIELFGVIPHITTGRDSRGRPNRGIDPGSRIWSLVGEWGGAELGLRVPRDGWALGGAPVPLSWHGPYWPRCSRFLP